MYGIRPPIKCVSQTSKLKLLPTYIWQHASRPICLNFLTITHGENALFQAFESLCNVSDLN